MSIPEFDVKARYKMLHLSNMKTTRYGASSQLVLTMKGGAVNGFTLVFRSIRHC